MEGNIDVVVNIFSPPWSIALSFFLTSVTVFKPTWLLTKIGLGNTIDIYQEWQVMFLPI